MAQGLYIAPLGVTKPFFGQSGEGRVWLLHTASSLAGWLPFMSRDVVASSLKSLIAQGLLLTRRERGLVKWAVSDEGFAAMGEEPTVSVELALGEGSHPLSRMLSSFGSPCVDPKFALSSPMPAAPATACHRSDAGTAQSYQDARQAAVRQMLSVPLDHWRLEKRRAFALARTRHNRR